MSTCLKDHSTAELYIVELYLMITERMTLGAGNQAGWSGWWDVPVVSDVDGCEIYQLSVESNHF